MSNSVVQRRERSRRSAAAGVAALYSGLSAGLLRQATYTTARLGIFGFINKEAIAYNNGKPLPLAAKAGCGLVAGGLGSLVGTPADLTLVRMQAGACHRGAARACAVSSRRVVQASRC